MALRSAFLYNVDPAKAKSSVRVSENMRIYKRRHGSFQGGIPFAGTGAPVSQIGTFENPGSTCQSPPTISPINRSICAPTPRSSAIPH